MPPKKQGLRQGSATRLARITVPMEGEKPSAIVDRYSKMDVKRRHALYDGLVAPSRINCPGFLANLEKNREPIPIYENHRVKATSNKPGDVEYVPATYVKLERDDYVIWQAPSKENVPAFWRKVWQDNVKIIVSLSDALSETDASKCYPYWPTKEGEPLKLDNSRYVVKLDKKSSDLKGATIYELKFTSTDDGDASVMLTAKKSSTSEEGEPGAGEQSNSVTNERPVTVLHYHTWPAGTWPNLDTLAPFILKIVKMEIQNMRKSQCDFLPPVVIQSHGGVGRAAVVWVGAILQKDIEKKECFDIPDLIRRLTRLRPGAFHDKLYYFAVFAVGFRQAGLVEWIKEDAKQWSADIEAAYKQYK